MHADHCVVFPSEWPWLKGTDQGSFVIQNEWGQEWYTIPGRTYTVYCDYYKREKEIYLFFVKPLSRIFDKLFHFGKRVQSPDVDCSQLSFNLFLFPGGCYQVEQCAAILSAVEWDANLVRFEATQTVLNHLFTKRKDQQSLFLSIHVCKYVSFLYFVTWKLCQSFDEMGTGGVLLLFHMETFLYARVSYTSFFFSLADKEI